MKKQLLFTPNFGSLTDSILEYGAKVLAPESILAQARGEVSMTQEEKMNAQALVKQYVEPGDLILTQTPSAVFGIFRDMG